MYWSNFLHIYQPADQVEEILDKVANESYRPLVQSLLDNPSIKITLNINAALSEQFVNRGHEDIVAGLRTASERGQIEFTDTAKYHALLPFLSADEMKRQIVLNRETNSKIYGKSYNPIGFFPPEMAYSSNILPVLSEMGYKWVIIDEIGLNGKINQINKNTIYEIEGTDLMVFFRERNPSNLIMSALVRREQDFHELMKEEYARKDYMITGMDGETFGHHRPGLQTLLTGLLTSKDFNHKFISELPDLFSEHTKIQPVTSTWASTEKDIENGVQFLTWLDKNNQVHLWQWELQALALKICQKEPSRSKLDLALASDQFFWASARPWWSLEVIEKGAWMLMDSVLNSVDANAEEMSQAKKLYQNIISKIFEWQRTGYIRKVYKEYTDAPRIPFKVSTVESGEPWVFDAFIELMREAMKKSAQKENFEEATIWRDAIWKLETKNDIYDSLHAVDLLRKQISNANILDMIGKYRAEYERVSSGQPEQRGI